MNMHHTQLPDPFIRPRGLARGRRSGRCLFRFSAALGVCVTLAATVTANGRDILRGGSGGNTVPSAQGIATGASSGAVANQARANAMDAMARTTRALQSVQAMQTAARSAAIAGPNNLGVNPNNAAQFLPNVTNGLSAGGLEIATGAAVGSNLWKGANLPTQTVSGTQTTVNIKQTSQQAILNWNKFNVGKETKLNFDQSTGGANAGQWIAFNKINDPSGVPSQILGSITAQGQVYVVNQNGIIFGGSSQVNTHALVASSLPINDNLINRGLLNNPDSQFLFTSLPQTAGTNGTPGFTPPAAPNGKSGDVIVQRGAVLSSPTTADHTGGRVALIGPNVTNAGTISTPDGQTILAAGQQVGLAPHPSTDAAVRGLDVYVGTVDATSGKATNAGLVDAPRANVTMTGKDVNQLGVINSSTSVSLNGSISLFADYNAVSNLATNQNNNRNTGGVRQLDPYLFLPTASGTVTLGGGSVTQILPEIASTEQVVGTKLALQSQVQIQGQAIHLAKDSVLLAPSANIGLSAGTWNLLNPGGQQSVSYVYSKGQIYLDAGALINAAGSADVAVSVAQNIIPVQLRGSELKDSPLQRNGVLRGQTVTVDIRQDVVYNGQVYEGTPIGDVSGYKNLIQRSVGELTTTGGKVSINAGGSVVMQAGAKVDVSGGWINYTGATVQTSRVISGGQIYDISKATPNLVYQGIYTGQFTEQHPKWSVANTFASALSPNGAHFDAGYIFGGDGGAVTITAPGMALDGSLLGNTIIGPRQRTTAPGASSLALSFQAQDATTQDFRQFSPTPPSITFDATRKLSAAAAFGVDSTGAPLALRADRTAEVILSPGLTSASGFGNLTIENNDGDITIPAGVAVTTGAGGSVTMKASNFSIAGSIVTPAGKIALSAYNLTLSQLNALATNPNAQTPPPNAGRGLLILKNGGRLSAAGLITDDRLSPAGGDPAPLMKDGGTISLSSFSSVLSLGSSVDVSGGVAMSAAGKPTYGKAGSLTIKAGQDLSIKSVTGGTLSNAAALLGYSGGDMGGTLSIAGPLIQIGGTSANSATLVLSPEFFSLGGFTNFSLTGFGQRIGSSNQFVPGVLVTAGTQISPVASRWVAVPYSVGSTGVTLRTVLPPEGVRTPVSLSLSSSGLTDAFDSNQLIARGDTILQSGAIIRTDAGGSITLSGNTTAVLGSLFAPGGSISVSARYPGAIVNVIPSGEVWTNVELGARSVLSTAGATVLTPDARGYRTGFVLKGGDITITGNIVAEAGSVLDVTGTTGTLDVAPTAASLTSRLLGSFRGSRVIANTISSDGGTIRLAGEQALFTDATLLGAAGGASARGGKLFIQSGRYVDPSSAGATTPLDTNLTVKQSGLTIPAAFYPVSGTAIGRPVRGANGNVIPGQGYFAADSFNGHGFDDLSLAGTVKFSGPVTLAANHSITAGSGGVLFGDAAVNLVAPYVSLGSAFQAPTAQGQIISAFTSGGAPFNFAPTYGTGSLTVQGSLIDLGNLSLQGFGSANFVAVNGDIRGNGTLDVAGQIGMTAGQIYPPTAVSFTIAAYDYASGTGSVRIAGSGNRQLPLSAGGQLNIYATNISQGGVLRAPFGGIKIGWDGTGTAPVDLIAGGTAPVRATKQVTLQPGSITSVSGVDPITGGIAVPYGINLNGTSWIDPTGTDITLSGIGGKAVTIAGQNVTTRAGSVVDIQGGGDLYAYRWLSGLGGSTDILASSTRFAVIPGYGANFAPYAPYNTAPLTTNLGTDAGYVNGTLAVGDSIYLLGGSGLATGSYTLLPARYALLPGAFLITPQSGTAFGTNLLPSGASIVSGYRYNSMRSTGTSQPALSRYEIATGTIVRKRAEYQESYANSFLTQSAAANSATLARLPGDAGSLVFSATQAMSLQGSARAFAPTGSRGGIVDINSALDILIGGPGVIAGSGVMALDSTVLSGFGAESLLIGGVRTTTAGSAFVKVSTGRITVNNAGSPLTGADVTLVAKNAITVADGAQISAVGVIATGAPALVLGDSAVAGSGNGTLLRVSADAGAVISRLGVNSASAPMQTIGKSARISGAAIILDSTSATSLDKAAILNASAITLDSGQISIQLANAGALQTSGGGLVLAGAVLQSLQSARTLSLLSYSSIDVYGTGTVGTASSENLQLHAGEIRRMDSGTGGSVSFAAKNLLLDNSANGTSPGPGVATLSGTLSFDASEIRLGTGKLALDRYAAIALNASSRIFSAASGTLTMQGSLALNAPLLTGAAVTSRTITAGGALDLVSPSGASMTAIAGGLGAEFSLQGTSVNVATKIVLPSGTLSIQATTGNLTVGGTLDVGGTARSFFDIVKYTDAGQISLAAAGNVAVQAGSAIRVAADPLGGNAGTLSITAGGGFTSVGGTLFGQAGAHGHGGSFSLDVSGIPTTGTPATPSLRPINEALNTGGFSESRTFRVRSGDVVVDGLVTARTFNLSADQGAITVANGGNINASGDTGGTIRIAANGSVVLQSGASLNVAAQRFDAAGKGGQIAIESGASYSGSFSSVVIGTGPQLDIQSGSNLNLGVAAATTYAADAALGHFTGTLRLRAPQVLGNADVQIQPIAGTIAGASLVTTEGWQLFNLTQGGTITNTGTVRAAGGNLATGTNVQGSVAANGALFGGNSTAIANRLLATHGSNFVVMPGAEIINRTGNLTLGTVTSTATADWNLGGSTFRFGTDKVPGVLTLRASGDLVFFNALSDGFTTSAYNAPLLTQSTSLPVNSQSWSYRLTAGADFSAADFTRVQTLATLGSNGGSLLLGKDYGLNVFTTGISAQTSTIVPTRYQVIRTGSGDITISAGRDVRLLNQFATIYTAGTRVADATLGGTFDLPILNATGGTGTLGAIQQQTPYPVQYSFAGGNVTISAQNDIVHKTLIAGVLTDDSAKELPINWLYRRGYVNPADGNFGVARFGDVASTTWWVDFSNFFEGVGTLGGGNLTMNAGHDVSNVDGLVATNARMPKGAPSASGLLELGGGDLSVRAGHDINAGVYYVERGDGTLSAGNEIRTNSTRSPSRGGAITPVEVFPPESWLPTTLFLGKGSFDVTARGNLLLGPVANPFLLPGGYNNTFWYKTYFSTYGESDAVSATSLGGSVTVRNTGSTSSSQTTTQPLLQTWLQSISLLNIAGGTAQNSLAFFQPWLRLDESNVTPFTTLVSLMPPTLKALAFSGDINLVGDVTLSPSRSGTVELTASGSINGLQPTGSYTVVNAAGKSWSTSKINLSDADPERLPGIASPYAFRVSLPGAGLGPGVNASTTLTFLAAVDQIFQETGSVIGTAGVLQTKQTLHAAGILHASDNEPIRLYGANGSISGLTLFSGKAARIIAGQDVTDFTFYIQNTKLQDVTLVSASRDISAYNPNSVLRNIGSSGGNILASLTPLSGDIQVSGPGTLEVFAGRNLTTGIGPNNADGTGVGITTIGNARNPSLPTEGAQVIAGAGIGFGKPDFSAFIGKFLDPATAGAESGRYLTELSSLMGISGASASATWSAFGKLSSEEQDRRALDIFYLVLRNAGRDYNDSTSAAFGTYVGGFAAIAALFPNPAAGDINLTSREIKTKSGGSIQILAPGGKLTVGIDVAGNQALDQGILTESGGGISIFTKGNVDVGTSRIFTLRGGDEIIWSSTGNIAAGASSKTVQSAPPTKVLVDPQSGDVKTDISGLATGGGIGVLASTAGVAPGSVDLIAPGGAIDAGDAGIRSTGKLNVAATVILNAGNISASGGSTGTPTVSVSAPSLGSINAGNTQAATSSSSNDATRQAAQQSTPPPKEEPPSVITVEVLGYGGGEG